MARFLSLLLAGTSSCRSRHMSSEVHLTRAQKWYLARLAGAAVASSVFFSLPIVLARPGSAAEADVRTASVKVAEETAIAGVSAPVAAVIPSRTDTQSPRVADAVAVVTSTKTAPITRPVLALPIAPDQTSVRPVQVRARVSRPPSPPTQPATLSRRLGRLLAGDGKYDPKPFPTVTTPGM
jgi:hypothetical protein